MKYLLIENKGELDANSLILMGGSTKRGDETKIGFFGSGNKYALALLLKYNVPFKIFSGNKEIQIETKEVSFRDKSFHKILIDGQETSLTTDMGPQWEMWQTVREFVSNAIDEGEYNIIDATEHLEPRAGYTRIYLPHLFEIEDVVKNWNSYFAFDRTDAIILNSTGTLYPQIDKEGSLLLYRKGIRCFFNRYVKSLYHYDLNGFDINESRVIENTHVAATRVIKYLTEYATVEVAFHILNNCTDTNLWEHEFYWYTYSNHMNDNWLTAIGNRVLIVEDVSGWFKEEQAMYPHFIVTKQMAYTIRNNFPNVTIYGLSGDSTVGGFRKTSETEKMKFMLKKAFDFFNETNYLINYPILVGEFSKENQLGGIGMGEIQVATKVFEMGMKELVKVIVEENEHLKTKFSDCSREFQSHFINMFISEKEERFAYFL